MRANMKVNGKNYRPAELDFNNVCRMEEMGASITNAKNKSMSLMRAYVAITMNVPEEVAGKELEAHIIAGGKIDEIADCMTEAMEESGFFQALQEVPAEEAPAVEKKKRG